MNRRDALLKLLRFEGEHSKADLIAICGWPVSELEQVLAELWSAELITARIAHRYLLCYAAVPTGDAEQALQAEEVLP